MSCSRSIDISMMAVAGIERITAFRSLDTIARRDGCGLFSFRRIQVYDACERLNSLLGRNYRVRRRGPASSDVCLKQRRRRGTSA